MVAVSIYLFIDAHKPAEIAGTGNGADPNQKRPLSLGMLISSGVGFVSSLLGIGGGIIHVPALVRILDFPIHIATATSHLILAITALTGTIVHIVMGTFHHGWRRTICLAVGVVVGAQVGAKLSARIHGTLILRALALALFFVGLRLLAHLHVPIASAELP